MTRKHNGSYSVSRTIRLQSYLPLEELLSALEKRQLGNITCQLMGTNKLRVTYDAARISFYNVLGQLRQAGITPLDSRWFRIKAAWYDYTDGNAAVLAKERPKPCCNRVPRS